MNSSDVGYIYMVINIWHKWHRTLQIKTAIASCVYDTDCLQSQAECTIFLVYMVKSWNCGCLVTWFCYQLIAKPGNKTAAVPWLDPYVEGDCAMSTRIVVFNMALYVLSTTLQCFIFNTYQANTVWDISYLVHYHKALLVSYNRHMIITSFHQDAILHWLDNAIQNIHYRIPFILLSGVASATMLIKDPDLINKVSHNNVNINTLYNIYMHI